jgi:hypothetical protein
MYSALTDWSSDMKRCNGRDRFQKTERETCASQKCILKKSAVLLLQRFCDRICLGIISVVCAQTLLRVEFCVLQNQAFFQFCIKLVT